MYICIWEGPDALRVYGLQDLGGKEGKFRILAWVQCCFRWVGACPVMLVGPFQVHVTILFNTRIQEKEQQLEKRVARMI